MSRGARECFGLLRSYQNGALGKAVPFQSTLASRLGVGERMVRKYIRELVARGLLKVHKRQRSSAWYEILRPEQKFQSSFRSEFQSKATYPYMSRKAITTDQLWPRKPPTMEDAAYFAEDHRRYLAEIEECKRRAQNG